MTHEYLVNFSYEGKLHLGSVVSDRRCQDSIVLNGEGLKEYLDGHPEIIRLNFSNAVTPRTVDEWKEVFKLLPPVQIKRIELIEPSLGQKNALEAFKGQNPDLSRGLFSTFEPPSRMPTLEEMMLMRFGRLSVAVKNVGGLEPGEWLQRVQREEAGLKR